MGLLDGYVNNYKEGKHRTDRDRKGTMSNVIEYEQGWGMNKLHQMSAVHFLEYGLPLLAQCWGSYLAPMPSFKICKLTTETMHCQGGPSGKLRRSQSELFGGPWQYKKVINSKWFLKALCPLIILLIAWNLKWSIRKWF